MATEKSKIELEVEAKGFQTAAQALTRVNTSMEKLDKVISKLAKNTGMAAIDKLTNQIAKQQGVIAKLTATHKASVNSQVAENKKLAASLRAVTREQEKTKKLMQKGDMANYKKITTETARRKVAEEKLRSAIRETNKVQKEQLKVMKAEDKVLKESIKGVSARVRALERLNKTELQYEATIKKLKDEIKQLKGETVQYTSNTDRLADSIKRANGSIVKHQGLFTHISTAMRASKQLRAESVVIIQAQQKSIDRLNVAIARTNDEQSKAILISRRKVLEDEKLKMQASASLTAQKMQRDSMKRLEGTMNKWAGGIRNAGRMLSRYLTPAMLAAVTAGVKMAANIETQIVRFSVLTGSMEEGAKLYKEIIEFSAVTPFQLPDLDKAAQILLAFGSPLKSVMNELRMLGDIAMGDAEKLERITTAFGKVRSRGTAHMRELNRFIMAGVPIFQELRKNIGGTGEELFTMVRNNQISFERVNEAVTTLTAEGGRFHDMTLKTSKTLEGRFSTALDNLKLNLASIFEVFSDELKGMLEGFIAWSQGFRVLSDDVRANIGRMIVGLAALGPALVALAGGIKLVTSAYIALKTAGMAMNPVFAILTGIAAIITTVAIKYKSLKKELDKAGDAAEKVADYTKQMNNEQDYAKVNIPGMNRELFETAKQYDLVAEAIKRAIQAETLRQKLEKGYENSVEAKEDKKAFGKEGPTIHYKDGFLGLFGENVFDKIQNDLEAAASEGSLDKYEESLNKRFNELASINTSYRNRVEDLIGEDLQIDASEAQNLFESLGKKGFSDLFTKDMHFLTKDEFFEQKSSEWAENILKEVEDLESATKMLEDEGYIGAAPLQTFIDAINSAAFSSLNDSAFNDALATTSSMINKLLENKRKVENAYVEYQEKILISKEVAGKNLGEDSTWGEWTVYQDTIKALEEEAIIAEDAFNTAMDNFSTNLLISMKSRLLEIEQSSEKQDLLASLLGISNEKDTIKNLEAQLDDITSEFMGLDYTFDELTAMQQDPNLIPDVVQELVDAATKIQGKLDVQLAHKKRISLFETFFEGDIKETEITLLEGEIKTKLEKLSTNLASADIQLDNNQTIIDVLFGHMQTGTLDTFIGELNNGTKDIYDEVVDLYDKLNALNETVEADPSHTTLLEAMIGKRVDFGAYLRSLELEKMYEDLETEMEALTADIPGWDVKRLARSVDVDAVSRLKLGDDVKLIDFIPDLPIEELDYEEYKPVILKFLGNIRKIRAFESIGTGTRPLIEAMVGTKEDFEEHLNSLKLESLYDDLEARMNSIATRKPNMGIAGLIDSIDMRALGKVGDEIDLGAVFGKDFALKGPISDLEVIVTLFREIKGMQPLEDVITKTDIFKDLWEGTAQVLKGSILPAFDEFGRSIRESASGMGALGNVFTGFISTLSQALPSLMLEAGFALLTNSDTTDDKWGWSLIAGSGLMAGLDGFFGADKVIAPSTTESRISYSAKGDAFNKGYITDGPMMRNAGYGVSMIGEDGREAVMPLARSSSGKLGVKGGGSGSVYVNVTNNTNAQVSQEVRENTDGTKSIEFLITETVKKGMATGAYDKTLQRTYGNTRRGR